MKEGVPFKRFASEMVQGMVVDSGPLDGDEADALSALNAKDELVAVVRQLKWAMWLARRVPKGLYVEPPVFNTTL